MYLGPPSILSRFGFSHLIRPSKSRITLTRTVVLTAVAFLIYVAVFNHRIPTSSWQSIARLHGSHVPTPLPDPLQNPALAVFWKEFAIRLSGAKPNSTSIKPSRAPTYEEYKFDPNGNSRVDLIQLKDKDLSAMKQSHKEILSVVKQMAPRLPFKLDSRGIVMTAGKIHFGMALAAIRMLRRVGSELPIELFLNSWADYDVGMCERTLPSLNARCVILSDIWNITDNLGTLLKYQYKVFALLFSSFEEVIFLDADAFPVRSPDNLLDSEPYKSSGLVMWPDFWVSTASHLFYDISGIDVPSMDVRRASESGIILYSKRSHAASLLLATYYNYFGPDFYYPLLTQSGPGEGDKETFIHAALALNETFYAVRTPVTAIGSWINGTWFSAGMKQGDPIEDYALQHQPKTNKPGSHDEEQTEVFAKPLFLHNNMIKLEVGYLVNDYAKWRNQTGHRVRLWGPEAGLVKEFGYDVEHALWDELLGAACGMQGELCKITMQIVADLFGGGDDLTNGMKAVSLTAEA